jgi:hypothetical protein
MRPEGRLLARGEVRDDVLPLVPLAALDHPGRPEDLAHGLPQALGALDDAQEALLVAEAPLDELPEERRAGRGVLGPGLDEPQAALLPRGHDPERGDQGILGEDLPIEEQADEWLPIEPPLLERLELPGAGPDEASGHGRGREPEGLRDRLGGLAVLPTAQPAVGLAEEAGIRRRGRLEGGVRGEGDLEVPPAGPGPGASDRGGRPSPASCRTSYSQAAAKVQGDEALDEGNQRGQQPTQREQCHALGRLLPFQLPGLTTRVHPEHPFPRAAPSVTLLFTAPFPTLPHPRGNRFVNLN